MTNVIDADSHVMEPRNTWLDFMPKSLRDEALTIIDEVSEFRGFRVRRSFLTHAGRRLFPVSGATPVGLETLETASALVRADANISAQRDSLAIIRDSLLSYEEQSPDAARIPKARLKWMDDVGIEAAIVTPTWGSMWERYLHDRPRAIVANMEAYNRWINEFCAHDPKRLYPVAQITPLDLDWAELEVRRLAAQGVKVCALRPVLYNGKPLGHPEYDKMWSILEDYNISAYFHVSGTGTGSRDFFEAGWFHDEYGGQHNGATWAVAAHVPILLTLTNMIRTGLFARHARLRVAVVEHGCTWVKPWISQFDAVFPLLTLRDAKVRRSCPDAPSEYIARHVWFTPLDRESIPDLLRDLGERRLMFSTDFPHPECSDRPLQSLDDRTLGMSELTKAHLAYSNAVEFLGS